MKYKIFLQYYSRLNFGDDLFVRIFAQNFPKYSICLLGNPAYIPNNLGTNVHISPFSYVTVIVGILQGRMKSQRQKQRLQWIYDRCVAFAKKSAVVSVKIGGFIFMDAPKGQDEVCFDVDPSVVRDFSFCSTVSSAHKDFIIGANLGPAYSLDYFLKMKQCAGSYAHICFQDYASFNILKDCPNVQYAPDVVFAMEPIRRVSTDKKVVISVIDPSKHTTDQRIVERYYSLLSDTIFYLVGNGHKVVLVSFCKREGDEIGIEHLLSNCEQRDLVEVIRYAGDLDEMIDCFADASFVIASRFHSMILAAVCGKPMFPIAYNCKTTHYLQDIHFTGTFASLDSLRELHVSDILRNYEQGYVCDCSTHHQYAKHHFCH